MNVDITKLGSLSYKELQQLNNSLNQEDVQKAQQKLGYSPVTPYTQGALETTYHSSGLEDGVGSSFFDEGTYTMGDLANNNFQDIRATNTPTALKWVNGLGKMAVLAGTTFADGIIGLTVGVAQGLTNLDDNDDKTGFWQGLWDNPFSRAMQDIQKWSERVMPNYKTREEQNRPWWQNLGTANFWADTVVKNLGFAIGAASGAGIISKGITFGGKLGKLIAGVTRSSRAEGLTNAVVGNSIMALNEGRVEALHNTTDWEKTQLQELENRKFLEIEQAKQLYGEGSKEYYTALDQIREGYKQGLESIEQGKIKMGNSIMGLNVPVLMLNNMFMYSKLFSGGANTMRKTMQGRVKVSHGADDAVIAAKKNLDDLGKNATKAERKAAKQAVKDAERTAKGSSGSILDVEGHIGQYLHDPRGKMYGVGKWLSHGASEGAEELTQRMISEGTGQHYGLDIMESYKAGKDPKYKKKAADVWESTVKGFEGSWGNGDAWEEFFVGAATGLLGIPQFRSRTYKVQQINEQTGELEMVEKKRSPIYLAGGFQDIMQDIKIQNQQEAAVVKYLNDRVQDPKFQQQLEHLAENIQRGEKLEDALKKNDMFSFKNEEFKSLIKDIAMFSQAGRMQDYKDLINNLFDTSDSNIKEIVEQTSSILEGTEGNPDIIYGEYAGQAEIVNVEDEIEESNGSKSKSKTKKIAFVNTPENIEFIKNKIQQKRDRLTELADLVEETKSDIDNKTGGRFTSEELSFLTNLRMTALNHQERARDLIRENKKVLAQTVKKLGYKDGQKLASLIVNTTGETLQNETKSRIDPRLKREQIENERNALLSLLTREEGELSDKEADSILGLFIHNKAFTDYLGQAIANASLDNENIETVKNTIKSIADAIHNRKFANSYNEALSNFLNKPDSLHDALDKADKEMFDKYIKDRIDEYYDAINQANDVQQLKRINAKFSISDDLALGVRNKAKEEKNERLTKLLDDYDELSAFTRNLQKLTSIEATQMTEEEKQQIADFISYLNSGVYTMQKAQELLDSIEENGEYTTTEIFDDPLTGEANTRDKTIKVSEKVQQEIAKINKAIKKNKRYSSLEDQDSQDIEEQKEIDDLDAFSDDDVDETGRRERKETRSKDMPLGDPKEGVTSAVLHISDQIKSGIINKILDGELDSKLKENGWTEEQIEQIKKEAEHLKSLQDSKFTESTKKKSDVEHINSSDDTLKSSRQETSQYEYEPLSGKGGKRQLVEVKNDKVASLRELGMYEFVDQGNLGKLLKLISYENKELPIHYIKGIKGLNDSLEDEILLAIEIDDELFSLAKIKPTKVTEINGKKYQIIGVLSPTNKEESKQSYENIKALVEEEYNSQEEENKNPIVSKHTNKIKRMYSGRMATSSESQIKEQRSIEQILPKYEDSNDYIIGFRDQNGDIQLVNDKRGLKSQVVSPNQYSEQWAGSRFIFTREADGLLYPKSISTRSFSKTYLAEYPESEITKEIKKQIEIIVTSKDENKILEAKRKLESILVFRTPNTIWVKMNNGNKVIQFKDKGDVTSTTISGTSNQEIANKLLNAILSRNFIFQISKNANPEQINKLIRSGCIISDIIGLHNVNADFVLHGVNEQGQLINEIPNIEIKGDIYRRKVGNSNGSKPVFMEIPGESNEQWNYDSSQEEGKRWTKGKSKDSVDAETQELLNSYYEVANELDKTIFDFKVSNDKSFAVKKGRTPGSYRIITDTDEIQELLRQQKEQEEKLAKKIEETINKEDDSKPPKKDDDAYTDSKPTDIIEINNDGVNINIDAPRRRRVKAKKTEQPLTEDQKENINNQNHC